MFFRCSEGSTSRGRRALLRSWPPLPRAGDRGGPIGVTLPRYRRRLPYAAHQCLKLATSRHLPSFENKCYDSNRLFAYVPIAMAPLISMPATLVLVFALIPLLSIVAWSQSRDVALLDLPGAKARSPVD